MISNVESLEQYCLEETAHQVPTINCKCGDHKPHREIGSPGSRHITTMVTPIHDMGKATIFHIPTFKSAIRSWKPLDACEVLNEIVLEIAVYLFGHVSITHHIFGPFASFTLGRCLYLLFIWAFLVLRRFIGWCGCGR